QPAPVQPVPPPPSPTPVQPAPPVSVAVAYRSPLIALVQPLPGGSVPQDRPVLVFRFIQGESLDPLDVSSFTVTVDGRDRSALFQLSPTGEAWGPMAPIGAPSSTASGASLDSLLTPGTHQVAARICSSRGACGTVQAPVSVLPVATAAKTTMTQAAATATRRQRLLQVLLQAGKKLLEP
ncbi:MAG: hypothetical protein ACR2OG_00495, partial [Gemmatimonadaceae bacterium]